TVSIPVRLGRTEQTTDLVLAGTVEDRSCRVGIRLDLTKLLRKVLRPVRRPLDLPALRGEPAEMQLHDLADVHPPWHTVRVQHHVDRRAVLHEGHVLDRKDLSDDTLVAVTTRQLVTVGDLALLRHVDAHELVHSRRKFVLLVTGEGTDTDDPTRLAVRHLQRGVSHLPGLFTEDRTEQAFLRSQLRLALRCDLADQDVTVTDLGTDPNEDRKSTRLNSSHVSISYAVFCLKKKK